MLATNKIFKAGLILVLFFMVNVFLACWGDCPRDIVEFDHTGLIISNVDNTNEYPHTFSDSTMNREAIAFYINVENNLYSKSENACLYKPFNTCFAFSKECEPDYSARQHLASIQILTLQTLCDTIPIYGDVTDLFAASSDNVQQVNSLGVYDRIIDIVAMYREGGSYQNGFISFYIFLMLKPDDKSVQFSINLSFDDGTELSTSTQVINLY
jgi:hypothetical protein